MAAKSKHQKFDENGVVKVKIRISQSEKDVQATERLDCSTGQLRIVDHHRIRIASRHSFPFYRKLLVEFPVLERNVKPLEAEVEVLGGRPHPDQKGWWLNECVLTDRDENNDFQQQIHDMALEGLVDRRQVRRVKRNEKVISRVELSNEECPVLITDTSGKGVGIFSKFFIDPRKKIMLRCAEQNASVIMSDNLVLRVLRQTTVPEGYLIGCRVIRGAIDGKEDQAVDAKASYSGQSDHLLMITVLVVLALLVAISAIW